MLSTLDLLVQKTFLDRHGMRFGDMHAALSDYFDEHKVNYMKYHSATDSVGSSISVMCMGIFAGLKVVKSNGRIEQEQFLRRYLTSLTHLIETTNYMEDHNSFLHYVESFWKEEKEPTPFEWILPSIQLMVKPHWFHDDYMIQLTLITLAFYHAMKGEEYKYMWMSCLREMVDMDTTHCFYDNGLSSRTVILF